MAASAPDELAGPKARRPGPWTAVAGLAVLPPVLLAWLVWRFGVDVPVLDQWALAYDFQQFFDGAWSVDYLVRSHNGHRLLVPRLVLIPLAAWSGWNIRLELALNLALGLASFGLVLATLRPAVQRWRGPAGATLLLLASTACFSLTQYENWLWGIMMHVFLTAFAVAVALRCLSAEPLRLRHWLGAALAGLVATLSHAAGLLFWWVAGIPLVLGARSRRQAVARAAAALTLAGVLSMLYVAPRPFDAGAGLPASPLAQPAALIHFALTYLGAAAASFAGSPAPPRDSGGGAAVGLLGLVTFLALGIQELRRDPRPPWLRFLVAFGAFSIGTAVLAGVGRSPSGGAAAFASRYTTLALPLWLAVATLLARRTSAVVGASPTARRWAGAGLLLLLAGIVASSMVHLGSFRARTRPLVPARSALSHGGPDFWLMYLDPELGQVRFGRPILEQHRLSVFRPGASPPPRLADPIPLDSFGQTIRLAAAPPTRFRAGMPAVVRVDITNSSPVPWPSVGVSEDGVRAVRLAYRWLEPSGAVVMDGERTALPHDVAPGDAVPLTACVAAPETPGRYRLRISLLQETVAWFDERGAPGLVLDTVVRRRRDAGIQALHRLAFLLGLTDCG
jgi:hypothetical protein